MPALTKTIKEQAHALGFELVGIAAATEADGFKHLQEWLARGYDGEMEYMRRHPDARRHPISVLADVRSVVMVGMNYFAGDWEPISTQCSALNTQFSVPSNPKPSAQVARYARGVDYHRVLWDRLAQLLTFVQSQVPACHGRGVVDTAPLLERDFARRARLGWIGKNTMLLNKRLGSYFFLGALLLDIELPPDEPHHANHCGSCTACLDACPTNAFPAPGVLDARRCISYLTIELRGPIPEPLRSNVGDWLFGCDICQEVCPWNRKAPLGTEPAFAPRPDLEAINPIELLGLSEEAFRQRFRHTAFMRAKRRGVLRNAAIVLGNCGDESALPALERTLSEQEPLICEAAQWAINRIRERTLLLAAEHPQPV